MAVYGIGAATRMREVIVSVIVKRARARVALRRCVALRESPVNYGTAVILLFPHFRMQHQFIIRRVK